MKVRIDFVDFEKAVTSAMSIKNILVPGIMLKTVDKRLEICSMDCEAYLKVKIWADVIEPGEAFVGYDDIKNLIISKGDVLYTDENGKISAQRYKPQKKISVPFSAVYEETRLNFPEKLEDDKLLMQMKESEFLEALTDMSKFTKSGSKNKFNDAYYLNGGNGKIYVCDGYTFVIRKAKECFKSENKAVLHGRVLNDLKKNLNKKSDDMVNVYSNGKHIMITGGDTTVRGMTFEYYIREIEGNFFDIEKLKGNANYPDCNFVLDADELKVRAKEYKKYVTVEKGHRKPMMFVYSHRKDSLYTCFLSSRCDTIDIIESYNKKESEAREDIYAGFNPNYIENACSIVGKGNNVRFSFPDISHCSMGKGKFLRSLMIVSNDDYMIGILPVNIEDTVAKIVDEYMDAA